VDSMADIESKFAVMRAKAASIKPGAEFVQDFALFESRLREDGEPQEGIDEIKQCIRDDWADDEKRAWWQAYVKREADFMRELQAMSRGITQRIKDSMNLKEAA